MLPVASAASAGAPPAASAVRLLVLMEALDVTGPARNLIAFASHADIHVVTFERVRAGPRHAAGVDAFALACRSAGMTVSVIPERFAFDRSVIPSIDALLRQVAPDIVETHNVKSHFLVSLLRQRRCPWVAFHHGYTAADLKVLAYNQLDRWSLRHAERVFTTCDAFVPQLTRFGVARSRVAVLHNAVVLPPFVNRRHLQIAEERQRVVLAVGRLSREKGQDTLLDACARLDGSEGVLLRLVGDGPDRARLTRAARRRGQPVCFEGHVSDVQRFYRECDVFVLPSRSEGSPNALLEAMAAACPIVATSAGGVPEILEDGRTGLLVPPDDPRALASAIQRLLADDELARTLGRAARDAARRFSPQARAARLSALYAGVLHACVC